MKKLLIALVLGLLLVAALATVASADGGPHGRFNGSTEACASCHRIHSASSADGMLLAFNDVYSLCTSCHDGTGAYTNVVDGFYDSSIPATDPHGKAVWTTPTGQPGLGLFAGGFVNARMLTDYGTSPNQSPTSNTGANINASTTAWAVLNAFDAGSSAPTPRAVTSSHKVGQTGAFAGTVWGSGNTNTTGGTLVNKWNAGTLTLECTSCHSPHGAAGYQGGTTAGVPIPSYRLLDFTPVGSGGYEAPVYIVANGAAKLYWDQPSIAGVSVPDPDVKWYTPNTDPAYDPAVYSYRSSNGYYLANFAGVNDYGGIYRMYKRPASIGTVVCPPDTTVPPSLTTNKPATGITCPASVNTAANPNFNNVPAQDVMGFWCATCHDRYLAPGGGNQTATGGSAGPNPGLPGGGSRTTDAGGDGYHYRHRSQGVSGTVTAAGVITAGTYAGTGQYTCLSCHNAHGTAAQASALASGASYAASSALLKGDNRAICLRCHGMSVNFFNSVTTPNAIMVKP